MSGARPLPRRLGQRAEDFAPRVGATLTTPGRSYAQSPDWGDPGMRLELVVVRSASISSGERVSDVVVVPCPIGTKLGLPSDSRIRVRNNAH